MSTSEAVEEIAISVPTNTEVEDDPPPETQTKEHQITIPTDPEAEGNQPPETQLDESQTATVTSGAPPSTEIGPASSPSGDRDSGNQMREGAGESSQTAEAKGKSPKLEDDSPKDEESSKKSAEDDEWVEAGESSKTAEAKGKSPKFEDDSPKDEESSKKSAEAKGRKALGEDDDEWVEGPNRLMYKAATEGNWRAAERLLREDESLGWRKITKQGDRALHLASFRKHEIFVGNLIGFGRENGPWRLDLKSLDGYGYTACCYAAMAGSVEVGRVLMEDTSSLPNVENWYGSTPFTLAIMYGNAEVAMHFLTVTEIEGFTERVWFDLLVTAISRKMLDVALKILENKKKLAFIMDDGGTALHVLAQLDISSDDGKRTQFDLLASKLWEIIQNQENIEKCGIDLTKPPILHDAAKVGNLNLINMIWHDHPDLLSHIDTSGHTMFHIVVMHRKENVLGLLNQARNVQNFNLVAQDKYGNNLLHIAGKSIAPTGVEIVGDLDAQMQRAYAWFKAVEDIVPPIYKEMRNKDGHTPIQLFWKEHAESLATSGKHRKRTAESCLLISTIVLSLVFAAAFSPPGGFDNESGAPPLLKKKVFAVFIIFEILALFFSTWSIMNFWCIISSNYDEHQFFELAHYMRRTMSALLLSVLFVISSFLCAFILVFVQKRIALVLSFMVPVYYLLIVGIASQIYVVYRKTTLLQNYNQTGASSSNYMSLLSRVSRFEASIYSYLFQRSSMCRNV